MTKENNSRRTMQPAFSKRSKVAQRGLMALVLSVHKWKNVLVSLAIAVSLTLTGRNIPCEIEKENKHNTKSESMKRKTRIQLVLLPVKSAALRTLLMFPALDGSSSIILVVPSATVVSRRPPTFPKAISPMLSKS